MTEPPPTANVITITAAGVSPKNLVVPRGSQIAFVNNDSRAHDMQSDPHPEHNDCPAIGNAGYLRPGESRLTGNLNEARTCSFHDNQNEAVQSLRGTIVIQ
ncbi:MAG TPA: hypothetical protein VJP86_13445 [Vicinamibacterales bacterium]|nr:hypothetical protein [Vicinamibacterales bacterium]